MTRKTWTVMIGDWDCKRVDDCHSEKAFSSSRHAHAFMWAKAQCRVPERCWLSAGMDGWDTNFPMVGKEIPVDLKRIAEQYIREEDDLQSLAEGVDLIVEVRPAKNAPHFIAYCKQMRCEICINDVSELGKLADEYAGILESESGMLEGSLNVNLKVSYNCNAAP
jgi:hypothetical protein